MTVSKTARLGLTRWDDDNDPWSRDDWDDDNAATEALVAKAVKGTQAARPSASAVSGGELVNDRALYYATDTRRLFYSDGVEWFTVWQSPIGATVADNSASVDDAPGGTAWRTVAWNSGFESLTSTPDAAGWLTPSQTGITIGTTGTYRLAATITKPPLLAEAIGAQFSHDPFAGSSLTAPDHRPAPLLSGEWNLKIEATGVINAGVRVFVQVATTVAGAAAAWGVKLDVTRVP